MNIKREQTIAAGFLTLMMVLFAGTVLYENWSLKLEKEKEIISKYFLVTVPVLKNNTNDRYVVVWEDMGFIESMCDIRKAKIFKSLEDIKSFLKTRDDIFMLGANVFHVTEIDLPEAYSPAKKNRIKNKKNKKDM